MKTYRTSSSAETKKLGYEMAKEISNLRSPARGEARQRRQISKPRGAKVIALQGELGAGKTTFTQGFLSGLGIKKRSASPTFIIFRRFKIKDPRFKNVFHVDAYRLKKPRELAVLGFNEMLSDPGNIVLIEWAENIKKILPRSAAWLRFGHGKSKNERVIECTDKP